MRRESRTVFTAEHYQGILPHPEHIERFEATYPGAAEMIFAEFKAQGEHRRKQENRVVFSNVVGSLLGQVLAFILLGGVAGGGIYLVATGKDIAGFGIVGSAVVSGLWAIHAAREAKRQETSQKRGEAKK